MLEDAIQRSEISISHGNSIVSLFQAGDRSNNVLLWKMLLQLIWKVAPRWSWPQDYLLLASYKYLPSIYIIYTGIAPSKKKKRRILMISANSEWSSQKYCTFIYLLVSYELQLSNNASLFPCQVVVQEKHTLFIAQVCATDLHNVQF